MPDLTELQAAQAVEITDTAGTDAAKINTALPSSSDPALTVREVRQGQQPMATSVPVVVASNQTAIPVTISTQVAATPAGEPPFTRDFKLFDFIFLGQDNRLLWYETLTGGATTAYSAPNKLNMTCGTASGDKVIRQTQRIMGQGGVSLHWDFGAIIGAAKANVRQRVGAFDADDGFFFEQTSTALSVVVRTSVSGAPVDTAVTQANWNIDKLDGTGTSGITLNTSYFNVYFFTYNNGYIKFGIIINGNAYFCHEVFGPNIAANAATATRNLPFRAEIENTGTAASSTTMSLVSTGAFASGGTTPFGIIRSVDLGITGKTVGAALTPLISIRLKSSNYKNQLVPESVGILLSASQTVLYQIIFNASLTGASFAAVPRTNTISEYDTAATPISGGDVIYSNYTSGSGSGNAGTTSQGPTDITSLLKISSNIAGTADIMTLAAIKSGGGAPTAYASFLYKELV